jgi:hypothetical protein
MSAGRKRMSKRDMGLMLNPSGVAPGPHSVETLLDSLYDTNPEALINGEVCDLELH